MKKRILIFSSMYFPLVGGAEVAIKEITDRLGADYEYDLITARIRADLPKKETIGNITVHRLGVGISLLDKLWVPFGGVVYALSLHKKNPYHLFWAMMVSYASGAAYIANWFLKHKVPIVLTLQEGDPDRYLRTKWFGLVDFAWKMAAKQARLVTAISTYLGGRAKEFGAKDVVMIPNGVNIAHFEKAAHQTFENEKVVLVTTSRLVEKNAVDVVIQSLPLLPKNVVFHVYGTGPDEKKLKSLAKELQVDERVQFLGWAAHDILPEKLREADIFIRPSRSEGMGNSFVEAMAAGLLVIATKVGGIPDFLEHEETGLFVTVDDPKSVAEEVQKLINNKELREHIIKNAKKMVEERYDWNTIAKSMEKRAFKRVLL